MSALGPRASDDYLTRLEDLLGVYRVPLQMTCKALFNRRRSVCLGRVAGCFVETGDIELVKLFYSWNWNFGYSSDLLTHSVPVMQFLIKAGLADQEALFDHACDEFDREAIDYLLGSGAISRRKAQQIYFSCYNVDALEYLYSDRRLPITGNFWTNREEDMVATDVFGWTLRHQFDEHLSVDYFRIRQDELLEIFANWCKCNEKDVHLMRRVANEFIKDPLPVDLCKILPPLVANGILSNHCQCGSALNHGLRDRPQKKLKFSVH